MREKKRFQTIISLLLAVILTISMLIMETEPIYAMRHTPMYTMFWESDKDKVHIKVKDVTMSLVSVEFPIKGYRIKNLRSSSKNCTAKVVNKGVTYKRTYDEDGKVTSQTFEAAYNWINFYAAKRGAYQVSFDITDASGKIIKSKSLKIYADNGQGIASVKLNGDNVKKHSGYFCVDGNKIKVQVKLNKGYKLQKIQCTAYRPSDDTESIITLKNGKTYTLPKIDNSFEVEIFYRDKYTGHIECYSFLCKQWKNQGEGK